MPYRTYQSIFKVGAFIFAVANLAACASSSETKVAQWDLAPGAGARAAASGGRYDGREPSSMKGDFGWLNQVEDDFGRIADETSSRAVASANNREVLMKEKDWSFSYLPKNNRFYVELQGQSYTMVQTRINDGDRFAFAAEGQAENPLTFAVAKAEGREVASEGPNASCDTDISYWDKSNKAYVAKRISVKGKACERMLTLLKDYVP